jgi:hypothetical protein
MTLAELQKQIVRDTITRREVVRVLQRSLKMCPTCNGTESTSAFTNFMDWRITYPL